MSVNNYRPHLLVIPEDDANRQLANGFVLEVRHHRRVQVLVEAGSWSHVCDDLLTNHQLSMRKFPKRHVLLLLDFDNQTDRRVGVEQRIPSELRDRVFVLGVRSEPEKLKQAKSSSFEEIGRCLAVECRDGLRELWKDELLRENFAELARLEASVRPFLFDKD